MRGGCAARETIFDRLNRAVDVFLCPFRRIVSLILGQRRRCREAGSGWDLGPPDFDSGVREPRRPNPLAGAGAVALPLPC